MLVGLDSTSINVSNFHTFGCLCYRLQSVSRKNLIWGPLAKMRIYVGCSSSHASNVRLILNPRTGHISPQFHVVYDDDFSTQFHVCLLQLSLHTGLNWLKLLQFLKFILNDK
jgi:hypothetical protein